jgi:hypothetical protein
MKNKSTTILSVVAVLVTVMCVTGPAGASPLPRPNLAGGAPTVVSYQGQVIVDGSPYNGTGFFKFAVVDAEGATSYWSNDGSSSDGGEPEASVSLTVTDGLFNVLLGDDALGMIELTAEAFGETGRYLRVWFSTDDGEFLLLTPDRRIAAMPYALQAEEAAYAADAGLLNGQAGPYYQARVSGACAVGSTVRAINPDGTVVCQAGTLPNRAVAPTGNVSATLDSTGDVGEYTSVTIGVDGLPLISYFDDTNSALKVAHCSDPACTSATVNTMDSAGWVGLHPSVIIGADGLGLITYHDRDNDDLKVAHCSDLACTSATINTLDGTGGVGYGYSSLIIGADSLPLITYTNANHLMMAHCDDPACTSNTVNTVSDTLTGMYFGGAGTHISMAIGVGGLPWISYHRGEPIYILKVLHCADPFCTSATMMGGGGAGGGGDGDKVGMYNSITIGADGLPLITYYHYDFHDQTNTLRVTHCDDQICWTASTSTLDSIGTCGGHTSVTVGADGLPLITYHESDYGQYGNLKVAHCLNPACTAATVTTLDSAGNVGQYSSVTIGADGLPLITYYDATNSDLKVFHCSNALCAPYFRRR